MASNDYQAPAHSGADLILEASRERASGQGIFPRIPDQLPSASRYDSITVSGLASLYSFTVIHPNPKTGQKPFILAYVDYPEKVRIFGQLVLQDGDVPQIGMSVKAVPVTSEGGETGYHFIRPEAERGA